MYLRMSLPLAHLFDARHAQPVLFQPPAFPIPLNITSRPPLPSSLTAI